jgi:CRP-like cAMP-binding protein
LKKGNEGDGDEIIHQCCKELKYRKYQKGEAICRYGEEGDEFYVILKGRVTIYTP